MESVFLGLQIQSAVSACSRHCGRADQPRGLAVLLQEHRGEQVSYSGHLLADGNGEFQTIKKKNVISNNRFKSFNFIVTILVRFDF